jgi:hypothetical protein
VNRSHGPNSNHPDNCFGCHVLTVQLSPAPFQPHYNYAVGAWVTNQQDFDDRLKRLADKQSERTGINSVYEPIHPSDLKHSPPPEAPPDPLPRLVAHDEHGHAMHDPVDADPSLQAERRRIQRDKERRDAERAAQTSDLIHAE